MGPGGCGSGPRVPARPAGLRGRRRAWGFHHRLASHSQSPNKCWMLRGGLLVGDLLHVPEGRRPDSPGSRCGAPLLLCLVPTVSFPVRFCELLTEPAGGRGQKCGAWGLTHSLGPCPPPADCAPTQDTEQCTWALVITRTPATCTRTHTACSYPVPCSLHHTVLDFPQSQQKPRTSGPLHMLFFRLEHLPWLHPRPLS